MKDVVAETLVLIPVYNDWESAAMLLPALDAALDRAGRRATVLIVDDGSTEPPGPAFAAACAGRTALAGLHRLELRRNLGHQRALCIALAWIHDHAEFQRLVVMDGDGEDDPAAVPALLDAFDREQGRALVFAERTRRSESTVFKVFYHLYKLLHLVLTGRAVKVGNFSVISPLAVDHLVVVPDLWNHYAASAAKTRLPFTTVPSSRAPRYAGTSRMNFPALAVHGLAALSAYSEIIGVRLLMTSLALMGLAVAGLLVLPALRVLGHAAPVWSTYLAGFLAVALLQVSVLAAIFILIILAGRQAAPFLPIRDYTHFVRERRPLAG